MAGNCRRLNSDKICLGLPEYIDRQVDFAKGNDVGFEMFTGLRHSKSWVGCGLSYKLIMKLAKEQGFRTITVCEDDVEFLPGWEERYMNIQSFLQSQSDWDLFSGLIADLHSDVNVIGLKDIGGEELVYLDKMVSTVFNIYSERFYQVIIDWDPNNHDVKTNTIDRFIESRGRLRVVTTHPFLVGHKEELQSTIWGAKHNLQRTY